MNKVSIRRVCFVLLRQGLAILAMTMTLIPVMADAQTSTVDQLVARRSIFLRDRWIDSVKNDTTGLAGRVRSIMTADAVYQFVAGRMGAGGGGSNWANTNLTFTGNRTHDAAGFNYYVGNIGTGNLVSEIGDFRSYMTLLGGNFAGFTVDSSGVVLSRFEARHDSVQLVIPRNYFSIKGLSNNAEPTLKMLVYDHDAPSQRVYYQDIPAGGNVFKVGTPVNNQVGVWTGDGTLEGDANLTFNAGNLTLSGGVFTSALYTIESGSMGTPSAGRGVFYFKTDNLPYGMNDAGTEMPLFNTNVSDGDKGDITVSSGVWSVDNDVVTYSKMQNVSATNRFLGRITAGAGDPEELTGTQATTLLDVFTSTLKGVVPSSGGGTTNFLRADGTWAAPPGGGGGWGLAGNSINAATDFIGTTNNTSMRFWTNNAEKMVLDSNGRLGIGIAAPTSKLHVFDNTTNGLPVFFRVGEAGKVGFGNPSASNAALRLSGTTFTMFNIGIVEVSAASSGVNIIAESNTEDIEFKTGQSTPTTKFKVNVNSAVFSPATSDPTGENGGMYYNSTNNRMMGYENGAWKEYLFNDFGSDALGDIIYRNSSGYYTRLPIGTTDQVLHASEAGIPEWRDRVTEFRPFTIETPGSSENLTFFYTDKAITITKVADVLRGSGSPSVTYDIHHAATRDNGTPNEVFGTNRAVTSTSGSTTTTFSDPTIPAGSWVWIITSATAGTVDEFSVTITYRED